MDAVISIGSQSLIDGLLRLFGPALQALRGPLPIAVPGMTNGLLTIKNVVPVLPGVERGKLELRVDLEIVGEILLTTSVAAGTVTLGLGSGTINLAPSSGHSLDQPARDGTLSIAGLGGGTGTLALAAAPTPAALSLGSIIGTIDLPAGAGDLSLPLPAVVPVAIDVTRGVLHAVTVILDLDVNGAGVDTEVEITAATGFGLEFGLDVSEVRTPAFSAAAIDALRATIDTALANVVTQLVGSLGIVQPALDLASIATGLATSLPDVVASTLTDALSGILARTGRLIYPSPGAGASCDVRALPTSAKAKLAIAGDGSLLLQVGFDRTSVSTMPAFPAFSPTGLLDTQVTISNAFLLSLLCCLFEKIPNLTLPVARTITSSPTSSCCVWTGVTVNLGVVALTGSLRLCINGGAGAPKTIDLAFDLGQRVSLPVVGETLVARVAFTIPITLDLSDLTAITNLRLTAAPTITDVTVAIGSGLWVVLAAMASGTFLVPGVGGALLGLPPIAAGIASTLLRNVVNLVLSHARLLQSPVAIPGGVFDAFGKLAPVSLTIDDLVAHGVLETPTSPWAVLPLDRVRRRRQKRPPLTHVPRSGNP